MDQVRIECIAIVIGLLVLGLGITKWIRGRRSDNELPLRFFAGLTVVVGLLMTTFGGVGVLTAQNRFDPNSPSGTIPARFIAASFLTGKDLEPKEIYLYLADDLANSHRLCLPEKGISVPARQFDLRPGVRYLINAEVEQPGLNAEWAATESRDWRHFDLLLIAGSQRINLQTTSAYVKDGIPENPNGRFLLFTMR